jgi:hypothetical protein
MPRLETLEKRRDRRLPMTWAAVIFVSLATAAAGQSTATAQTPSSGDGSLPVSLAHIRKALDQSANAPGAPKLRLPALDDGTNVGPYVRPANGAYDHEFKQMMTPDPVKGCGRLTSQECFQSYANQFLTGLLWQRATDRKKLAGS